jgi:pimeloyl-ACP methyl ester carboxylesterase
MRQEHPSQQGYGPLTSKDTNPNSPRTAESLQAALTALNVPKYWLVAHDIGACVAFSLALRYQDRLHGVALLDAGIPGITLSDAVPTDPERAWKTWHLAFHMPGLGTARDPDHRPRA